MFDDEKISFCVGLFCGGIITLSVLVIATIFADSGFSEKQQLQMRFIIQETLQNQEDINKYE